MLLNDSYVASSDLVGQLYQYPVMSETLSSYFRANGAEEFCRETSTGSSQEAGVCSGKTNLSCVVPSKKTNLSLLFHVYVRNFSVIDTYSMEHRQILGLDRAAIPAYRGCRLQGFYSGVNETGITRLTGHSAYRILSYKLVSSALYSC